MEDVGYEVMPSGFYSPVEKAIAEAPRAAGNRQAWLNTIKKGEGVTDELLAEHKLDDILGAQPIDKPTLLSHVRATKPVIEHVEHRDIHPDIEIRPAQPGDFAEMKDFLKTHPEAHTILRKGTPEQFALTPEVAQRYAERTGSAKFGSSKGKKWQTPGGTNYREHLLTLRDPPSGRDIADAALKRFMDGVTKRIGHTGFDYEDMTPEEIDRYHALDSAAGKRAAEKLEPYRSSHFDEPNILAHIRTQDFNQDGKKTLLLDEIQSDWHQAGRDKGYKSTAAQEALEAHRKAQQEQYEKAVAQYHISQGGSEEQARRLARNIADATYYVEQARQLGTHERHQELYDAAMAEHDRNLSAVPDAPFKNTWHQLALKKALQIAAKEGYDRIALTTGDTQNKRFGLEHHVSRLAFEPAYADQPDTGVGHVIGYDKDGREAITHYTGEPKDVLQLLGKELGEKLLKHRVLEGDDIRVGGAGMKKWYDEIMPRVLDKIGRRYGTRVGRSELPIGEHMELEHEPREGEDPNAIPSKTVRDTQLVHHLDITPELRRAVLGGVGYAEGGAVDQARDKWLEGSVVKDRLYTGTSKDVDFNKFKIPKSGAWFTTSPEDASDYAMENDSMNLEYDGRNFVHTNTASRVLPVHLKITNPARYPSHEAMIGTPDNYKRAQGQLFDKLRAAGHDGVIIGGQVYVVIGRPHQIKSAIGNSTFNPSDPRIHMAKGGSVKDPGKPHIFIHAGSDFTAPDLSMLGRGEGAGGIQIRPLGRRFYGYLARDPEEIKTAVETSRRYLAHAPTRKKAIHAFQIDLRPGDVAFHGKVFDESLLPSDPHSLATRDAYRTANNLPPGPERSAAFDIARRLDAAHQEPDRALHAQQLWDTPTLIEVATDKLDRLKRLGKWAPDATNDEITQALSGHLGKGYAEGGSVEHPMIEVDGQLRHRHNSNGQPIHPTEEGLRNFHRWFGDSKTVDEHGRPLVMYHGTTHPDITAFNPRHGTPESALGAGTYTTSSREDASTNYAGEGPDLTGRIERKAEEIANDMQDDPELMAHLLHQHTGRHMPEDQLDSVHHDKIYAAAMHAAKQDLKGGSEGLVMPLYVKTHHPFEVRHKSPYLEIGEERDEHGDPIEGAVHGSGLDLANALHSVAQDYGGDPDDAAGPIWDNGGVISHGGLFNQMGNRDAEWYDPHSGELVSHGHVLQQALRDTGKFDAMLQDAHEYFGPRKGPMGTRVVGMAGLHPGTLHVLPFHPHQIKSALGNSGAFDPNEPDITKAHGGLVHARKHHGR